MRLVENFDAFLIDIDGTVISGGKPVFKSAASLRKIRKAEKPFLFVTNNTHRTQNKLAEFLTAIGIQTHARDIITSANSTALFIRQKFKNPESKKAFVSGSPALRSEIRKTGIQIIKTDEVSRGCDIAVIGGYKKFSYADIAAAYAAIRNGAAFLATNPNLVYPAENGELMPATGALAAPIEKASGKKPTITGKPSRGIFQLCLEILRTAPEKTAVVGDSLKTDIKGGSGAGLKTILTLTGISSREDAKKSRHKPDYVIKNLSELF